MTRVPIVVRDHDEQRAELALELGTDGLHDLGLVLPGELDRELGDGLNKVVGHDPRIVGAGWWGQAQDWTRLKIHNLGLGTRI